MSEEQRYHDSLVTDFDKVKIEKAKEVDDGKKHGILAKLQRSDSSSSSSSDDEGEGKEAKEKKRKKKNKGVKDIIEEKIAGEKSTVPVPPATGEKKGFLEKIKDTIPGHNNKHQDEEESHTHQADNEKKGILEKIKEKISGGKHGEGDDEKKY